MDRFNALGRGMQLMAVGAVLLIIDLFLPWQDFDFGGIADELGVDATFSGWRGIGVILGILTILLIAWIALQVAAMDISLPVSGTMIAAGLGALVLVFGIIKMLTIIDDEATIWAWIGLALTVVIAVGAWMQVQAAGGIDTLKSEMPNMGSSGGASGSAPPPPPPAAPSEPAPPAEAAPSDTTPEDERDTT